MNSPTAKRPTPRAKDELSGWGIGERVERIGGREYRLPTSIPRRHREISRALFVQFHAHAGDTGCAVFYAPFEVRFPVPRGKERNVVQPDLVLVCDPAKVGRFGCRGAPDLIVEIVTSQTYHRDTVEKLRLYEEMGVAEYWIVFPDRETIAVHRLGGRGVYAKPRTYTKTAAVQVASLGHGRIDLTAVFPA
ncbi:MAG: Uma2 family endonuclease [Acidobacteria bacterium]|nr:Uma2 family endonuclease [Acidobacteriota bacterium]